MTHPGVPTSPGFPPLEGPARDALRAAQDRLGVLTGRPQFPPIPPEEREEALENAAATACLFCGAWHEGASTPACPRLAEFKLNGDGKVIEGKFWPDGVSASTIETDGSGEVRTVIYNRTDNWDTSRVVRVQDAAEDDDPSDS